VNIFNFSCTHQLFSQSSFTAEGPEGCLDWW